VAKGTVSSGQGGYDTPYLTLVTGYLSCSLRSASLLPPAGSGALFADCGAGGSIGPSPNALAALAGRIRGFDSRNSLAGPAAGLERDPCTQLKLAAGRGRFRDRAELRRVDEAVGRIPVRVVQRVEGLAPKLDAQPFGQRERADQREIHRLHARPVDGIPSHVAEGVRGWVANEAGLNHSAVVRVPAPKTGCPV